MGGMSEYPDVTLYVEALERELRGRALDRVRLASPFLLRSVEPPLTAAEGREVRGVSRMGKRLVLDFGDELYFVLHLMITGRLRWKPLGVTIPKKRGLAAFDFAHGSVLLTEASTQKRASLHVVQGADELRRHDPGGLELFEADEAAFAAALARKNHTLKRALTNPRILSGIGNAYSDEILHHARLSPFKQTSQLSAEELTRLFASVRAVLTKWTDELRAELKGKFPDKVTAFRDGMAVHGRYREPCRDCGTPVQRIVYASNETNYCATCQTGGKLLADRSLSTLLKDDWPKTVEEWES